jgi:hypothetical protein
MKFHPAHYGNYVDPFLPIFLLAALHVCKSASQIICWSTLHLCGRLPWILILFKLITTLQKHLKLTGSARNGNLEVPVYVLKAKQ